MASGEGSMVERVMGVIEDRRDRPPDGRSYVVSLLRGGVPKIGEKVVEEAAEVVEAAAEEGDAGRAHLVHEVADLLFHTLVLMGHRGIAWAEIESELGRRFGVSGIDEKESRGRA
jgi:phosphoribosyl-ATP pyrophosphohydrolase